LWPRVREVVGVAGASMLDFIDGKVSRRGLRGNSVKALGAYRAVNTVIVASTNEILHEKSHGPPPVANRQYRGDWMDTTRRHPSCDELGLGGWPTHFLRITTNYGRPTHSDHNPSHHRHLSPTLHSINAIKRIVVAGTNTPKASGAPTPQSSNLITNQ
jgi:hypothetical protein